MAPIKVLETVADVAKGLAHIHSLNLLHSDVKTHNVLLKSSGSEAKGFTAKVRGQAQHWNITGITLAIT